MTRADSDWRAVVLAGGRGTRLLPLTYSIPKPMMAVGDTPILEIVLRQLRHSGFSRATIAVNHLASQISGYFGDGAQLGIAIDYAHEDVPRGTIGPLAHIDGLGQASSFLVMNGDLLTDVDYAELLHQHDASDAWITVATCHRQTRVDFGVVDFDDAGRLCGFREKPVFDYNVSMGVYAISGALIPHIPRDGSFGFDQLMEEALRHGWPVRQFPWNGLWLDIGRHEDYLAAEELLEANHARLCPWEGTPA